VYAKSIARDSANYPITSDKPTTSAETDMDTTIVSSLRYVEMQADTAYIDSRVYCSQIIKVNHSDWMHNVIRKHQLVIESRFGHLRFENGDGVKRPQGGGKQEVYVLLTEPQCNFALSLSRNTSEVVERKADLIADFERAKQFVRSQLTQQLATTQTAAQLKTALTIFPNTLEKLWKTSGIVNKSQVKKAILRDFVEERDYIWADGILCVNDSTFHILAISFRSLKGADVDSLPEIIQLKTREYFRYQADKKMNRRIAQDCEWEQPLLLLVY
jgi:hypothetical protein